MKIYVATSDAQVHQTETTIFHFDVAEISATGTPEQGKFTARFHAPGKD